MITRPINTTFKVNDTSYTVRLSRRPHSCIGCSLYDVVDDTCKKDLDIELNNIFGTCAALRRKDNKHVIFVKE